VVEHRRQFNDSDVNLSKAVDDNNNENDDDGARQSERRHRQSRDRQIVVVDGTSSLTQRRHLLLRSCSTLFLAATVALQVSPATRLARRRLRCMPPGTALYSKPDSFQLVSGGQCGHNSVRDILRDVSRKHNSPQGVRSD